MTGQITRNTAIAGEHVAAGEIVEVDEATFRQLKACGKITPAIPAEDEEVLEPGKSSAKRSRKKATE